MIRSIRDHMMIDKQRYQSSLLAPFCFLCYLPKFHLVLDIERRMTNLLPIF